MMTSPESAPSTLPRDRSGHLHTLLSRLRHDPDHTDLADLYDLTSPVVHSWALANTADHTVAGQVTVAVYTHLWHQASRYPAEPARPWPWLQAALLLALHRQPTETAPEVHS